MINITHISIELTYVARPFSITIQHKLKIKIRYILHVGVGNKKQY